MKKKPERDVLPLELHYCYMEIFRKEQNLTPLFNCIRNEAIDEYEAFLPDVEEISQILNDNLEIMKVKMPVFDIQPRKVINNKLAQAIAKRIGTL